MTETPPLPEAYAKAVQREQLDPPWQDFWIDVLEPEMGDWLDLLEAFEYANVTKTVDDIEVVVAIVRRMVVAHNLVRRDGSPLEISVRQLTPSQTAAIVAAINRAGGGSASPLPRATSPGRSATSRKRSRRTT